MIDEFFPNGIPDAQLDFGRFRFIGCAACTKPVAVAYFYHEEEVPIPRIQAFLDLAAALSGALIVDKQFPIVAGVIVTPHPDAGYLGTHVVYPVNGAFSRIKQRQVIQHIRLVGMLATNHQCGATVRSA
ncbi:MAG TPA: hypothetical protein VLA19_29145 [Herpetosiphonaceae bacterium]|nr:hypothetical protein [Herpetosiphonaceae bacterium]